MAQSMSTMFASLSRSSSHTGLEGIGEDGNGNHSRAAARIATPAIPIPPPPPVWDSPASFKLASEYAGELISNLLPRLEGTTTDLKDSLQSIDAEVPSFELAALVVAAAARLGPAPPPPPLPIADDSAAAADTHHPDMYRELDGEFNLAFEKRPVEEKGAEFSLSVQRLREIWIANAEGAKEWAVAVVALCSMPVCPLAEWLGRVQQELTATHLARHLVTRRFDFAARAQQMPPLHVEPVLEPRIAERPCQAASAIAGSPSLSSCPPLSRSLTHTLSLTLSLSPSITSFTPAPAPLPLR